MFDTVVTQKPFRMSRTELMRRGFQPARGGERLVYNPTDGKPRLAWFVNRAGVPTLTAEVSLPKLLTGGNVHVLNQDELENAIDLMDHEVSEAVRRRYDLRSQALVRVDACAGFPVGEMLPGYLEAIGNVQVSRMDRMEMQGSVTFQNRGKLIIAYQKENEVRAHGGSSEDIAAARGVLRLETRYRNAEACRKLARDCGKATDTVADLLTEGVSVYALETAMAKLGLDRPLASHKALPGALLKHFEPHLIRGLIGFIELYETYGRDMVSMGFVKRSTYYATRRELAKVGLLTTAPRALPPLRLVHSGCGLAKAA